MRRDGKMVLKMNGATVELEEPRELALRSTGAATACAARGSRPAAAITAEGLYRASLAVRVFDPRSQLPYADIHAIACLHQARDEALKQRRGGAFPESASNGPVYWATRRLVVASALATAARDRLTGFLGEVRGAPASTLAPELRATFSRLTARARQAEEELQAARNALGTLTATLTDRAAA